MTERTVTTSSKSIHIPTTLILQWLKRSTGFCRIRRQTHTHTPQVTAVCLLPSRVHSHTRGVVPSSTLIVREDDAPRISGEMLSDEICRWSVSVITARQHDECDTTTSARTNVHDVWTTRRLDNRLRPTTKHRKLEIKKFYMFVFWKIFLRSSSTGVRIKYWGASTKGLVFKIKKKH